MTVLLRTPAGTRAMMTLAAAHGHRPHSLAEPPVCNRRLAAVPARLDERT